MLFNSFNFLVFFPLVTLLYFLLPHKFRWSMLLTASCIFYMFFKPVYILIIFFTIIIDYYAGILIENAGTEKKKKRWLAMSIVANVGVLAVFKYYNFLNSNLDGILSMAGYSNPVPYLKILLPIGLSFHTFQAMSYTIEVSRGNQKAERHFGIYALYVMFYPQLVAGPIERPQNILHQFYEKHKYSYELMVSGLRLMLWGFFKKLVIADRISLMVDEVYKAPEKYSGPVVVLGCMLFTFQIYCDFSGYSDIALGAARTMGFRLMKNFDRPLISKNLTEFWRRWHISLSSWFNDYFYTPFVLANRDWGKIAVVVGLLLTFSISGLWHGANWTFVIYGALNGIVLVYEFLSKKFRKNLAKRTPVFIYNTSSNLLLFAFVSFSYIFFRSDSIHTAFTMISSVTHVSSYGIMAQLKNIGIFPLGITFIMIVYMHFVEKRFGSGIPGIDEQKPATERIFSIVTLTLIIALGEFNQQSFIYFQF
jgi:alginate O-acetyltransferase complex protein AlgI